MCHENTGRWTKATQKGSYSTSLAYSIPQETLLMQSVSIAAFADGSVFFQESVCLKKVPYEVETTGDLVLKILPISSNWKMMRSTDFLLFCSEKWHPKALKCPWKYGGPDFHRHSQRTPLNGDSKCSVPVFWPTHLGCRLLALTPLQSSMACAKQHAHATKPSIVRQLQADQKHL